MRVQTEEWRRFIPGVRMYKGKLTLFYNEEKLCDRRENKLQYLIYDEKEREKWEVIIVFPGVEVIPEFTFEFCINVETVIMSDSVKRIEDGAFMKCKILKFVRLSKTMNALEKVHSVTVNLFLQFLFRNLVERLVRLHLDFARS